MATDQRSMAEHRDPVPKDGEGTRGTGNGAIEPRSGRSPGVGVQLRPRYEQNPAVRRIIDASDSGLFCPQEPGLFRWISRFILDHGDVHFHPADLPAYIETQDRVGGGFRDPAGWVSKAILNVARIGRFSSDRTVREYARDIWKIGRVEG